MRRSGPAVAETVLAIVAHPDDESFWMGGALAGLARNGKRIAVVAATDGLCGRTVYRETQFQNACEVLGVKFHAIRYWFPDQAAETVPFSSLRQHVLDEVNRHQPSLVLTHYYGDLNRDHRIVSEAVLLATRDVCPVWLCEPEYPERAVVPSVEWQTTMPLLPTLQETKWAACQCYPEELAARPKTRSRERFASERWIVVP